MPPAKRRCFKMPPCLTHPFLHLGCWCFNSLCHLKMVALRRYPLRVKAFFSNARADPQALSLRSQPIESSSTQLWRYRWFILHG